MEKLLDVQDLRVSFFTYAGEVKAVRGVNFHVNKGEAVAIVGESGCGKSVTAQSLMKLIPNPPGKIVGGKILFEDRDVVDMDEQDIQRLRGNEMGMIFQDPMTSLNPTMTIGRQITEVLIRHQNMSAEQAKQRAIEMLTLAGIPTPEKRFSQYPHEFSGGMRQRAMIAIALACNPKLLIADEPTTALDVTIQAQIIDLMRDLQQKLGTSIILITHDLGVVADLCSRVIVMYAGKVVETGSLRDVFYAPRHPYTWGLLKSVPRLDASADKAPLEPIHGTPPDLLKPPQGCGFAARCDYAMKICLEHDPVLEGCGQEHQAACWLLHPNAPKVEQPLTQEVAVNE